MTTTNKRIQILLLFFLFVILFLSCKKEEPGDIRCSYFKNLRKVEFVSDSQFNVMTWNIHLGFRSHISPWSNQMGANVEHLDSMVEIIKNAKSDIILLQEVPLNRENTHVKKVMEYLASKLNYNFSFGGHGLNSNGQYPTDAQWGNAVLSKFPIIEIENKEILNYNDKWTRRSVLKTNIQLTLNKQVSTFNLHFEANKENPCNINGQLGKSIDFCKASSLATILAGDFNCGNQIDSLIPYTNTEFPKGLPYGNIDRIYISKKFESQGLIKIEESRKLSDHYARQSTLKIIQ